MVNVKTFTFVPICIRFSFANTIVTIHYNNFVTTVLLVTSINIDTLLYTVQKDNFLW